MNPPLSLNELLFDETHRYLLFGGKGGVGKTSCASAAAILAAQQKPEKKILIVSTDPAHSLADSLGQKLIKGEVTAINDFNNLWGLEISPQVTQEELTMMTDPGLGDLGDMMPFLGNMGNMGGLTPPGMDEAVAFGKILEFLQTTEYDKIIFDTAPTGHTLRFLSLPDVLSGWMGKLMKMKLQLGKLLSGFKSLFSGGPNPEAEALDNLKHLKEAIDAVKGELTDPTRTSFIIVLIAEDMAVYETERLLTNLIDYEIPVDNLIVNQLIPKNENCPFCLARRKMQQRHLKEIIDLYADDYNIIKIPQFEREIRKIESLQKLGKIFLKQES